MGRIRQLRIEPLENRLLNAVDFDLLVDSNVSQPQTQFSPDGVYSIQDRLLLASPEVGMWQIGNDPRRSLVPFSISRDPSTGADFKSFSLSIGDRNLFMGVNALNGSEVWSSDGTLDGTYMLRDFSPGPIGTQVAAAARIGHEAFLLLYQYEGVYLWRTDGTIAGTTRLLWPPIESKLRIEGPIIEFESKVFFVASTVAEGDRVLASFDPANSVVKIHTKLQYSQLYELHRIANHLVVKTDYQLWRLDSSGALQSILDAQLSGLGPLKVAGESGFVRIRDRLWITDGTKDGTLRFLDDSFEFRFNALPPIEVFDGKLIFLASRNSEYGYFLSDGRLQGTRFLGIRPLVNDVEGSITKTQNELVVLGVNGLGEYGFHVLRSGSQEPSLLPGRYEQTFGSYLSAVKNRVFFRFGSYGPISELDLSTGQTIPMSPPVNTAGSQVKLLAKSGQYVWFLTFFHPNSHLRLWRSDGTPSGTIEIRFPKESLLESLSQAQGFDDQLIFEAVTTSGTFQEDQSRWSVHIQSDFANRLSPAHDEPLSEIVRTPQGLFQMRASSTTSQTLYHISDDFTQLTAIKVFPERPEVRSLNQWTPMTVFRDRIYFEIRFREGTEDISEHWSSDGTAFGTSKLNIEKQDAQFATAPVNMVDSLWIPTQLGKLITLSKDGDSTPVVVQLPGGLRFSGDHISLGNKLLFLGRVDQGKRDLWSTDGTAAGTKIVQEFGSGKEDLVPKILGRANGRILISTTSSRLGTDLWSSDGTADGTSRISHLPFENHLLYTSLPDGRALISMNKIDGNTELWISDGTLIGTSLFSDFTSARLSLSNAPLVANNYVITSLSSWIYGNEPFAGDLRNYKELVTGNRWSFFVDENVPGDFIGQVRLPSIASADVIDFRWKDLATEATFSIDPKNGLVHLQPEVMLDFETIAQYTLVVEIRSRVPNSTEVRTDELTMDLKVINQSETPRIMEQVIELDEDTPIFSYVGNINAIVDPRSAISYRQDGGPPVDPFWHSGDLFLRHVLDYEQLREFPASYRAYDLSSGLNGFGVVVFHVRDIDEAPELRSPPPSRLRAFTGETLEYTFPAGTFIDPEGKTVQYAIETNLGTPLPKWLAFDPLTRTLIAMPTSLEPITTGLTLLASDPIGNKSKYQFTIEVFERDFQWHNRAMPMDVDYDGFVTPLDILILVNFLNSDASKDLLHVENTRPLFLDVDRDNSVSALDALTIINQLNKSRIDGEGESDGSGTDFWDNPTEVDSMIIEFDVQRRRKHAEAEGLRERGMLSINGPMSNRSHGANYSV